MEDYMKCGYCKYWLGVHRHKCINGNPSALTAAYCHAVPPSVDVETGIGIWPRTYEDDVCGSFSYSGYTGDFSMIK